MDIFANVNKKLLASNLIDSNFSGSTAVTIYMMHDKLYCANLGDSRAIVG